MTDSNMSKDYDLEEDKPNIVGESAVLYNTQQHIHTELAYDVPNSIDIDTFRDIMNTCAMNIIAHNKRRSRHALSDQELEKVLSAYPSYDEVHHTSMDEITKEDYSHYIRNKSRKPIKGIEKWL